MMETTPAPSVTPTQPQPQQAVTVVIAMGEHATATQKVEQMHEIVTQLEEKGHTIVSFNVGTVYPF